MVYEHGGVRTKYFIFKNCRMIARFSATCVSKTSLNVFTNVNGSEVIKKQTWMFRHRTQDLSRLSPTREALLQHLKEAY